MSKKLNESTTSTDSKNTAEITKLDEKGTEGKIVVNVKVTRLAEPTNFFGIKVVKCGSPLYLLLQPIFMASALIYAGMTFMLIYELYGVDIANSALDPNKVGIVLIWGYIITGFIGRQLAFIHPPEIRIPIRLSEKLVSLTENLALIGGILILLAPTQGYSLLVLEIGLMVNLIPSLIRAFIFLMSEVKRVKLGSQENSRQE